MSHSGPEHPEKSAQAQSLASGFAASARWHLYDFNTQAGEATLVRLEESSYRQTAFLDQRLLPLAHAQEQLALLALRDGLRDAPPAPSLAACIFHLGHCGSTLLSRALAASPRVLPLREPLTLRQLSAALHAAPAGQPPPAWPGLLDMVLTAHARVFQPGQRAMLKATSTCNNLIAPTLQARPHCPAILMYVRLEDYLAGMLGKLQAPADLHGLLHHRLADWQQLAGAPVLNADALDEPQLAALAWLTGMQHLDGAHQQFGDRTRLLDFEQFLAQPEHHLAELARFTGLEQESTTLLTAWPDIATSYSKKTDEPYSAFNRRKTLQRGRSLRAGDIRAGLAWASQQTAAVPALAVCEKYF